MDGLRSDGFGDDSKIVALHEQANEDVVAACAWLSSQPFVDKKRMAMMGVSFGGIQTVLSDEKSLGLKAFVAFAPAAMSWRIGALRERLLKAVQNAQAPLFILQAENDYNLGPVETLGPEAVKKGGKAKTYPAFGTSHQDGHWRFATLKDGIAIWGPDVMDFLQSCMK